MSNSQPFLGFYITAVKNSLGIADTYLRGMQRIRQSQIDQIGATGQECARWLKQAETVHDFDALHSLNSDVLGQTMERVSSYWDKVGHDMGKMQLELSGAWQDCSAKATQDARHQVEQMQTGMSQGAVSLLKPILDPTALFAFSTSDKAEAEEDDEAQPGDHNGSMFAPRSASAKRRHGAR